MRRHEDADRAGRGRFAGPVFATVVLIAGLFVSSIAFAALRGDQRDNARRAMDQRSAVALAAVRTETERYRELIEATAAGIATDSHLTWEDFDAATAPLASADLAGAAGVAYVVPASTAEIPAVQRTWRARGSEGLVLRPAGSGEHYFTIFSRLLDTAGQPLDGIDASASAEASEALDVARHNGQPSVSDAYVLLRDRNLPAARQQPSLLFVAPLWTRASYPDFRGWIVLGLRGQDFLTGVLAAVGQDQLGGELLATGRDDSRPAVAGYRAPGKPDLERRHDFLVADREWTLVTRADSARLSGARSAMPVTVLVAGAAMTLVLAGLVHALAAGRTRAWAEVRDATARDAPLRPRDVDLGDLAICRRIVERHGGEIGVADDPGGGTRLHFTLPVPADREETTMTANPDDAEARAALERALAERAVMENSRLPGLSALPAADPSAHDPAAARLRSPVPDHHPTTSAAAD